MNKKEYLNNIPIYDAFINDEDESGIKFISLVDDPAIEIKGFCFNKDILNKYELSANKERQIVAGPAMIPNKLIIRQDKSGNNYYIRFSKEVLRKMFNKFFKTNNNKSINIDHTNRLVPGYIEQFWFVEDTTYDKSKIYGYNLPIGTPFIEVRVEDKEFWKTEVKELSKCGFSIQGDFGEKLSKFESEINNSNLVDVLNSMNDVEFIDLLKSIN